MLSGWDVGEGDSLSIDFLSDEMIFDVHDSMCFVWEWNSAFLASVMAPWLSAYMVVAVGCEIVSFVGSRQLMLISERKSCSHFSS